MKAPPLTPLVITDWFYKDKWFILPLAWCVVFVTGLQYWNSNGFRGDDAEASLGARAKVAFAALVKAVGIGLLAGAIGRYAHTRSRMEEHIAQQCRNPTEYEGGRVEELNYECEKHTGKFCDASEANRLKCNSIQMARQHEQAMAQRAALGYALLNTLNKRD